MEVLTHPVKGRCLLTTRLILAGEVVLDEPPLLTIVAPDHAGSTCAACMRVVPPEQALPCSSCAAAVFCSPSCAAAGTQFAWLHGPAMCGVYATIAASGACLEDQLAARFLAHAWCLRQMGAAGQDPDQRYAKLHTLCSEPRQEDMAMAVRLAQMLAGALGLTEADLPELATLLRKDALNSYGVIAHTPLGAPRALRGSALYQQCALLNHECNPNCARFDTFDGRSTNMVFRAMHDLPPGTEVTQSYVPLNWSFEERQVQTREVYGFACNCARCQAECSGLMDLLGMDSDLDMSEDDEPPAASPSAAAGAAAGAGAAGPSGGDGGDGGAGGAGTGAAAAGAAGADLYTLPPNADEGPLEPTYLHLFLLKYVCPVPGCFGTLAPTNPEVWPDEGAYVYVCNVCGASRTGAQFLESLDADDAHAHDHHAHDLTHGHDHDHGHDHGHTHDHGHAHAH
ncbi:hypothetical protein FOA52_005649 [Chlamydomonas sp. UWO 241]|nr:hypothetical protein FOA52_005649 [Chlamydomonas sp. UWO 241]